MNLLSFFTDKIITVLGTVILALILTLMFQKWQIKQQKQSYLVKIERLEKHAQKLRSDFIKQLDEQNQLALETQNKILENTRKKEHALYAEIAIIEKEKTAHENRIKSLSNQLNVRNNRLHQLTQKASKLAKASISNSQTCKSKDTATASDKPRVTESRLSEQIIEASTKMGAEFSNFAEQVTNDNAVLQNQCTALKKWANANYTE